MNMSLIIHTFDIILSIAFLLILTFGTTSCLIAPAGLQSLGAGLFKARIPGWSVFLRGAKFLAKNLRGAKFLAKNSRRLKITQKILRGLKIFPSEKNKGCENNPESIKGSEKNPENIKGS